MANPQANKPPMALAMEWVAKITTVALEMVLPGLFGQWLDAKLGTSFLVLIGFALGLSGGLWHLLRMTKDGSGGPTGSGKSGQPETQSSPRSIGRAPSPDRDSSRDKVD